MEENDGEEESEREAEWRRVFFFGVVLFYALVITNVQI